MSDSDGVISQLEAFVLDVPIRGLPKIPLSLDRRVAQGVSSRIIYDPATYEHHKQVSFNCPIPNHPTFATCRSPHSRQITRVFQARYAQEAVQTLATRHVFKPYST